MSGSSVPIEEVTRILVETAAEEVLPRFRNLGEDDKRIKAGGEVVTVVDEASERRLTQRLRDLLPGSLVVGEEATAADPGVFANLLDRWLLTARFLAVTKRAVRNAASAPRFAVGEQQFPGARGRLAVNVFFAAGGSRKRPGQA